MDHSQHLLQLAFTGDLAARNELFTLLREELRQGGWKIISSPLQAKMDSSDIVQSAMLDACRDFAQFRGATIAALRAWLHEILRNSAASAANHFRTQSRDTGKEIPLDAAAPPSANHAPDETLESRELREGRQRLFDQLSEPDRTILTMRTDGKLDYETIAKELNVTPEAARKRHERAMKNWSAKVREDKARDGDGQ